MYYVYSRYVGNGYPNGKETFINAFYSISEAVQKIASNYARDKRQGELGDYYYFYEER